MPDGRICFEGVIEEVHNGIASCPETYLWYPAERELIIDYSEYVDDPDTDIVSERYRVEYNGENEYRLYDIENVITEPDDYFYCFDISRRNYKL